MVKKKYTGEELLMYKPQESIGPILLDSQKIQRRVRELGNQITEDYSGKTPHLIGILKGASIFHSDLARAIALDLTYDFIAVGSYGDRTVSSGDVQIIKDLDESIKDRDIILVEDIVDTGLTLNYLMKVLKARGPSSLQAVALLNKPSCRKTEAEVKYIGFDIPDEFVIGYGLDYAQRYRNLTDICILRSAGEAPNIA
jgi:hypoxanthine phosphoribosyltransferase